MWWNGPRSLSDTDRIEDRFILFSHEVGQTIQPEMGSALPSTVEQRPLKATLARHEIQIINDTLAVSRSIRAAARQLGISHTALLNKLKKYRIRMETN